MRSISFEQYLNQQTNLPLVDVRSPGEYIKGHVPGAESLPLFSDEERAEVGTLYKQKSREAAMMRGLDLAGSKMSGYVRRARELVEGKEVAVHCWRGGQRSASIGTLLAFMGFQVSVIKGGYKAYRNYLLRSFFDIEMKLIVLGGKTGTGKTEVLNALSTKGEQVIDLEELAHHKGSAFGALGERPQPTVEQFENNLFEVFRNLNPLKRVWVENESKSIGRVFIPDGLWHQMSNAVFVEMEISFDDRVERLVRDYGNFSTDDLVYSFQKISKRLGGLNVKNAIAALEEGAVETAAGIALHYYDKAYKHGTEKKDFFKKHIFENCDDDPGKTAKQLIQFANNHDY